MAESAKEAGHEAVSICPRGYSDGRAMPSDHDYPPSGEALSWLAASDVIICFQGRPYDEKWYPRGKATVVVYVSQPLPRHISRTAERDWPWAVDGQYHTRLYPGCVAVPELWPLKHAWLTPAVKANTVLVAYSPSNTWQRGWDCKGFDPTVSAMRESGAEIDVITQRPLAECLARKARAHIVIDECMTGSYHANSLQGLALGCVVVNNCDALSKANIMSMTDHEPPFVVTAIANLADKLKSLVRLGPARLREIGAINRQWAEAVWDARRLFDAHYFPLIRAAKENECRKR